MANPYQKYKETSVKSASREKILLMLYEGAMKFTKLARKAIEDGDIPARGYNIGRAFDIIVELSSTLDHSANEEVSRQLEQLYIFVTDRLTQANVSGKVEHLDAVLGILTTLYEGWKETLEKERKKR